ncbi:MAG: hypothetical protein K0S44_87 [Bacteroidetes bacterium]|jgi:hypothetical protein|nr:hypothetical protein [Bacteroidota bacterium]
MKTRIIPVLFLAVVICTISNSCKKERDPDDKETITARDNALAENSYNDVAMIADQAAQGALSTYLAPLNSQIRSMLSACASIAHDTLSNPRLLAINFGTTNCLCSDGRYRRGIIRVSYTGGYRDSASVHSFTFSNYHVDDNMIDGTKTVVNNGLNSAGNPTYNITVNGQINKTNGSSISWTSNRTREWIAGDSTLSWIDDVYLISGTANGSSTASGSSTTTFTLNITTPLRKEVGCRHFTSGKFELTPSGRSTRYFDFGTGTCDNEAHVTINGHLFIVTLL